MIRLHVTDLDNWVKYIEPELEVFEMSDAEFRARLLRQTEPKPIMLAGTAFHALLEKAKTGDEFTAVQQDGFEFTFAHGLDPIVLPEKREASYEATYATPSGPVILMGRLDGITGIEVTDYKLTFGQFDAERYARSLQWRAYLTLTGAKKFRYLVFQAKEPDDAGHVWVYAAHELVFWGYPEMAAEVRQRVVELAAYVAERVPEMVS